MMPLSIDFANLHTILATLYDDMQPLCKDMMLSLIHISEPTRRS